MESTIKHKLGQLELQDLSGLQPKGGFAGTAEDLNLDIQTRVEKVEGSSLVTDAEITKLSHLDDTTDLQKPVSTAQQAAIDAAVQANLVDSTLINGVTTSSAIPPTGNIHAIGVGAGTYTNWSGMVVPANNIGTLSRVGGVYAVSLTAFTDINKILPWEAQAYPIGTQRNYLGIDWYLPTTSALSTDVPGISSKWVDRLSGYSSLLVTDEIERQLAFLPREKNNLTTRYYNTTDFSLLTSTGGDLSTAYYGNSEALIIEDNMLSSISVKSNGTGSVTIKAFKKTSPTALELLHTYSAISVASGTNSYNITDNFILPKDAYLTALGTTLYYNATGAATSIRTSNQTSYVNTIVRTSINFVCNPVNLSDDILTKTEADAIYASTEAILDLPKEKDTTTEIIYPSKDFSLMTLAGGDLSSVYYGNYENKALDFINIKSFLIKAIAAATATVKVVVLSGSNYTVLHTYKDISVAAGTNTYLIDDDYIVPKDAYIIVKCSKLNYFLDAISNSIRISNISVNTFINTGIRTSISLIAFDTKVSSDITTKNYVDNFGNEKDLNYFKFPRKQKLLSTDKIILYGDSISSTDYTWYKDHLQELTGAIVYNGGFSGATSAQLAANVKLQRIFDYNPNVIVCMLGGNDSGVQGTVGTFTNINGEPLVAETDINVDYNGTYYIQAISHTIRKIKAQYYNIRVRANLLGTETEAEKTAKIDALVKPYFLFCTPIARQITDATNPISLPENNQRKRDAVVECCLKYNIPCVDLFYNVGIDMSLEPYYVGPTDMVNNKGIYYMDGLHPNKYGYRVMAEIVASAINS